MSESEGVFTAWANSWALRIQESRPYWINTPRFPFPYNSDAPSIAYDPLSIPQRPLGPFRHLQYKPPSEANNLSVTREHLQAKELHGNLLHELKNVLLADPSDDALVLLPNRWPRSHCHSLLTTRQITPQALTPQLVEAEFRWVSYGTVVEFHKFRRFLNHFHAHIFPIDQAPIVMANASFKETRSFHGVDEGILTQYPVPHIAYFSSQSKKLQHAVYKLISGLDARNEWFSQVLLRHSDTNGFLFICFVKDKGGWIEDFSFNVTGLVRTERDVGETYSIESAKKLHMCNGQLAALRDDLWNILLKT